MIPEVETEAKAEGDNTVSAGSHPAGSTATSTPTELGPPQPTQPLDADESTELSPLEQELYRLRAECMASQKAIEESKRMNT